MALYFVTGIFLVLSQLCLSIPQYGGQGDSKGGISKITCETGFDCVPWQTCLNGFISTDSGIGIDQRTRPANFEDLKCGSSDHMCCAKGPPTGGIRDNQCGHASYACVPYFQCIDGEINTDGTGLIDIRTRPTGTCSNPEYPDVPAVCCLIPGSVPTPTPIESCPGYQQCVEFSLCSNNGKIVTDGSGLIDIRTGYTSCYLPSGIGGICCFPPSPIVDVCPGDSTCVAEAECLGKALDGSNNFIDYITTGLWSLCPYDTGKGVCCINPPPYLDVCPGKSVCLSGAECLGQALDASNNFIDYLSSGKWSTCSYNGGDGVCCIKPPPIVASCPGESICLPANECKGTAMNEVSGFVDYNPQGSWTVCSEYQQGVCCINPFVKPILQVATECGIRNYNIDSRITSKNEANFGEFPWQSIVFYQNYTFNCGASLISNKHVITAAHCVDELLPSDLRVRFGEWKVNGFDEALPYYDRNVHAIFIHPKFNAKNVHNDVAVLELVNPVDFQYHINTICLPKPGQIIDPYTRCFASGWGKDSFHGSFQHILKKIELPYIDHDLCQNLLRKTRLGKYFSLHTSFVCAGGEENKDACYGDGGGPLVCKKPNGKNYFLTGITSWGIGCGTKNVPGVYVDVSSFVSWIEGIVGVHGGGQQQQQQQQSSGYGK